MKILSFSYCFPNLSNPAWGMFVFQRLAALGRQEELQVCSPVPWFPLLAGKHDKNSLEESWQGLVVQRPTFFYIPGILKNLDAHFYARGLRHWLKELCRSWKPDVLDAHFVWPDGVGVAALAREMDIPYVITLRGKLYECLKVSSQTQQCTEALRGASAVISVSNKLADEARKMGVSEDHLFVIPNGVDKEVFYPREKTECRQALGLPVKDRLLVTVAHLGHRKGHHEVIQALAGLPDDVRLVIVGGAAQGGTPEKLKAVAREVGVEDRLILTGPQPYEKIPLYFSAADASVLASYREGCPNVVLESLACGTPVVASDVGAVPDILPVPDVGRIVPLQTVEPLREALADLLNRSWDVAEVVQDSRVPGWDRVAQEVQSVFKNLCIKPQTHTD